jgi:hypothetical protein
VVVGFVFLLLLFFRMEYLKNSEHFYFPRNFYSEISRFIFSEYTISDEIIELNSVIVFWFPVIFCMTKIELRDFKRSELKLHVKLIE